MKKMIKFSFDTRKIFIVEVVLYMLHMMMVIFIEIDRRLSGGLTYLKGCLCWFFRKAPTSGRIPLKDAARCSLRGIRDCLSTVREWCCVWDHLVFRRDVSHRGFPSSAINKLRIFGLREADATLLRKHYRGTR